MRSYQELFAELKRRHVFKVAAIYGATSFVILQIADILFPALRLPAWSITFMVAILLLAFPVALIVAWAFEVTPDGVKRVDAATPGELEQLTAAPASQRWPAVVFALAGVAALVAGVWWVGTRSGDGSGGRDGELAEPVQLALEPAAEEDARPAIAVLPFADMSPESDQAYFSDGITEEILNTLAKVRELKVAARTSAFAFRGRDLDMRAIGDSLGVAYLIEGSVRKSGDDLRITAQLIDAADGTHMWSESYDRTMDDVFAIQSDIAEAIANALRVPLGLDDASDLVSPTADLEAYDLYLAGRARMRERGAAVAEARRLFAAAIARDSSWAPAWAALAEASELSIWYPVSWAVEPRGVDEEIALVEEYLQDAVRAAERALALDRSIASAHVALGSVARNRRQWDRSERAFLEAISLDPDNAEAQHQYSEMLMNMGRVAEARQAGRRALDLDPAPIRYMNFSAVSWADGQPRLALDLAEQGIALDPNSGVGSLRWLRGMLLLLDGKYDDVFAHGGPPNLNDAQLDSVLDAYRSGDPERLPPDYTASSYFTKAMFYASIGREEDAIADIRMTLEEWPYGNYAFVWLPVFDSVRTEPGFQPILEKLNLAGRKVQRTLK